MDVYDAVENLRQAIDDAYNAAAEERESLESQLDDDTDEEAICERIQEIIGKQSKLNEAYRYLDCVERYLP